MWNIAGLLGVLQAEVLLESIEAWNVAHSDLWSTLSCTTPTDAPPYQVSWTYYEQF